MDDVQDAARRIASALAPTKSAPAARWRWGTVDAVNSDGTADVVIAGTTVEGIGVLASAMGAAVGDRVRVDYLGTEAVVAGVLATGAADIKWSITWDTTKVTPNRDGFDIWRSGKCCTVGVVDLSLVSSLASGSNLVIGTVPSGWRPPKYCYVHSITSGVWIRVTTGGEVRVSNRTGAALAAGTKVTFTLSYVAA